MEKILVITDSHGDINMVKRIIKKEKDCRTIIHLGDHYSDLQDTGLNLENRDVHLIRGNCDWSMEAPGEELIDVMGLRIFCTHGHLYGVKYTYTELVIRAQELEADLVLFGHTHQELNQDFEGIRLYNPGTSGRRTYGDPGYGIVYVTGNKKFAIEPKHF